MNNLLMWVGGGLAAALFALFAVPPFVDWNQYRGVFEEEVSRLLGREVRVGGRVSLRILPVPYVGFEKVRIADAPGIPGSFLSAERFTMLLSVPPLLRGVLEARQLEIDQPHIRLRFDEKGGGNWQTLDVREQELAFVPSDIALQSALIRDGQIVLETPTGSTITRIAGIAGELTAGALRGPLQVLGLSETCRNGISNFVSQPAPPTPTAACNFKPTATAEKSKTKHAVTGRLSNLDGAPRVTGELHTNAPLVLGTNQAQRTSVAKYDMRADIAVGSQTAQLSNIAISFDSKGRPQQLTGKAEADWRDGVKTSTTLKSKWLDIDAITGGQTKSMPLRALQLLSGGNIDLATLSGGGTSQLEITVEQANLGGEVASNLNVRVSNASDELRLDRVSAALPGGTLLRADGTIGQGDGDRPWRGYILLNGSSLDRFLNWANPKLLKAEGRAGGAFRIVGRFKYAAQQFELADARVRLAGHESAGRLNYRWGKTPELAVDWNGETLDLSGFGTNLREPQSLAELLGIAKPGDRDRSEIANILTSANLNLRLRADKVRDGAASISNLDILLAKSGGNVRIGRSRLTFEPGLELEIEGSLATSATQPRWDLSGLVRAASTQSTAQFRKFAVAILGKDAQAIPLVTATPFELAFTTRSDRTGEATTTQLDADGSLGPDRLRLTARSAGPVGEWRAHPLTIDAKIDGRGSTAFFSHLGLTGAQAPDPGPGDAKQLQQSNAHMRFRVSGVPEKGLNATAHLVGGQWQAQLRASATPGKAGTPAAWQGTGQFAVADLARAAQSMAPQWSQLLTRPLASRGHFVFSRQANRLLFEPIDMKVGRSTVSGRVQWTFPDGQDKRPRLGGQVAIDRLDVATVLAPIVKKPDQEARPVESSGQSLWPDLPFELKVGSLADANLKLSVRRLEIRPGFNLSNASMTVTSNDGGVEVAGATGKLFGGEIKAHARLTPAPAGVSLDSRIELSNLNLDRVVGPALRKRATGTLSAEISASGQALSPRALMTALRGSGRVKLSKSRFPGLDAQALTRIADEVVLGEADVGNLNVQLEQATQSGSVEVGDTSAQISISDGALQVSNIAIDAEGTRAVNQTTIDIVQLSIDSQWRIDTALDRALKSELVTAKQLPPVQVVYTGAIGNLSSIEPTISLGDLQRELTVQRMEHDVKRLERLRREDEERAKAEAERLQRLEQARIRALEEEARKRGLAPGTYTDPSSTAPYPTIPAPGSTTPGLPGPSAATPSVSRETLPPVPGQQTDPLATPPANQSAPANASAAPTQTIQAPRPRSRPRPPRQPERPQWNPFGSSN